TGLIFHTSLVALGLAALIATSEQILIFIKIVGMCYLLYLAALSWKDSGQLNAEKPRRQLGSWQLYRRGIIMNATNPKVALFFLAFLPQFVDVSYGEITVQVMLLGFLFMLSTVLVFGAIALLAGRYSERLNQSTQQRIILNRSVSAIFVLLALNLLFNVI
ncbi:MAG: LysE family translocator, partial [Gammaproteobacteria bacterium]|nr:LysE family translocator [Gammaproteobacteria bacterium]